MTAALMTAANTQDYHPEWVETGFLFQKPSAESFLGGVKRAFSAFTSTERLNAMRLSAMARSFSWDLSAACYNALYRKMLTS